MTNRELNAPPYKLLVRPSFTQSGCFRVIAWHPARIWVWTAPGTCTKYTRRPRGFAGVAAAVVSGFFPIHLPACKIHSRPPISLRVCTRRLAPRSARPGHTDARQTKVCAIVRLRGIPAGCAPSSLLPAFAAVRVRTPLQEMTLRAPVRSPSPAAAPQIPRARQTKWRWYPLPHSKRGPHRCAANLLRSGGSRASLFPCAPPPRSFPQAPESDARPPRFRSEKKVLHETSEWNAPPRERLPDRSKDALLCALAR